MTTTELRKTAWAVPDDNGDYLTIDGHAYLSDAIARELARETGNMPVRITGHSLKTVVVSR